MIETPLARQLANHVEKLLGFGKRQRRGRLVKDEHAQIARQSIWRSPRFEPAAGERVSDFQTPRVDGDAKFEQSALRRAGVHGALVDPGQSCQIVGCRPAKMFSATESCGDQRSLLVHDADAQIAAASFSSMSSTSSRRPSISDRCRRSPVNRRRRRSCPASTCPHRSRPARRVNFASFDGHQRQVVAARARPGMSLSGCGPRRA